MPDSYSSTLIITVTDLKEVTVRRRLLAVATQATVDITSTQPSVGTLQQDFGHIVTSGELVQALRDVNPTVYNQSTITAASTNQNRGTEPSSSSSSSSKVGIIVGVIVGAAVLLAVVVLVVIYMKKKAAASGFSRSPYAHSSATPAATNARVIPKNRTSLRKSTAERVEEQTFNNPSYEVGFNSNTSYDLGVSPKQPAMPQQQQQQQQQQPQPVKRITGDSYITVDRDGMSSNDAYGVFGMASGNNNNNNNNNSGAAASGAGSRPVAVKAPATDDGYGLVDRTNQRRTQMFPEQSVMLNREGDVDV